MSYLSHNSGLVEQVSEIGFDRIKYFEGNITTVATNIAITPPARRLTVTNKDSTNDVYLNITGNTAIASASITPGDNIKIGPGCTFNMDFDTLDFISLISEAGTVFVEGLIGFKGLTGNGNC